VVVEVADELEGRAVAGRVGVLLARDTQVCESAQIGGLLVQRREVGVW
jgi:hypothetical protein